MRKRVLLPVLAGLALAAAGCETRTPTAAGQPAGETHPGDTVLAVVGTPFLFALKIPACIGGTIIAAPVAAAAQLSTDPSALGVRHDIADGIEDACGPPWWVRP